MYDAFSCCLRSCCQSEEGMYQPLDGDNGSPTDHSNEEQRIIEREREVVLMYEKQQRMSETMQQYQQQLQTAMEKIDTMKEINMELEKVIEKTKENEKKHADEIHELTDLVQKQKQQLQENNEELTRLRKVQENFEEMQAIMKVTKKRQLQEVICGTADKKDAAQQPVQDTQSVAASNQQTPDYVTKLKKQHGWLLENILTKRVAAEMFQRDGLTIGELEVIQQSSTEGQAAEKLVNILLKQPREIFDCFMEALKITNQEHAYLRIFSAEFVDSSNEFANIIQNNYIYLVETMDTRYTNLVVRLYDNGMLRFEDKEEIDAKTTTNRKNIKLLSLLARKSSEDFKLFVDALDQSGQRHVADKVTGRQTTGAQLQKTDSLKHELREQIQSEKEQLALSLAQTIENKFERVKRECNDLTQRLEQSRQNENELRVRLNIAEENTSRLQDKAAHQTKELQDVLRLKYVRESELCAEINESKMQAIELQKKVNEKDNQIQKAAVREKDLQEKLDRSCHDQGQLHRKLQLQVTESLEKEQTKQRELDRVKHECDDLTHRLEQSCQNENKFRMSLNTAEENMRRLQDEAVKQAKELGDKLQDAAIREKDLQEKLYYRCKGQSRRQALLQRLMELESELNGDQLLQRTTPRPVSATNKEINILLLGETGVGKSTWINGLLNYLTYDKFSDVEHGEVICLIPTSFTITDENFLTQTIKWGEIDRNETQQTGQSATQRPKSYVFGSSELKIRIIDTPGIGDTRGVEVDKKNMQMIMSHLGQYDKLHGICILLKPNNARLRTMFQFCIKELLTHLHVDACKNMVFCFTNARGTFFRPGDTMPALQELLKQTPNARIPLNKQTVYCMDNESVRFLMAVSNGMNFDKFERQNYENSWNISVDESTRLLTHISELEPHLLQKTISLNRVRESILILGKPIAEISKLIQQNIDVIKAKQHEALQISMKAGTIKAIEEHKKQLEKKKTELQEEIRIINVVTAKFACFLNGNAIAPYNDAVKAYMDKIIQDEEEKVALRGDSKTLEALLANRRQYVAEIEAIEKAMKQSNSECIDYADAEAIDEQIRVLYNLPEAGRILRQMMDVVEKSNDAAAHHTEKVVDVKSRSFK